MVARLAELRCSLVEAVHIPLIALVTGVTERTVVRRLNSAHGNMLVARVFEDDWPTTPLALGSLTVATAARANLEVEVAELTGLGVRAVRNRFSKTRGNTLLRNALPELSAALDDEELEEDLKGESEDGRVDEDGEDATEEDEPHLGGLARYLDADRSFTRWSWSEGFGRSL